jgi:hypothetical protein
MAQIIDEVEAAIACRARLNGTGSCRSLARHRVRLDPVDR